jgi:hypothetical protein
MSLELGEMLLEFAVRRLLPTLTLELAGYALRSARAGGARPVPDRTPPRARLRLVPTAPAARPTPAVTVLSHVPGRVRFQAPGLRGDPARAALMLAALRDEPGVRTASASTLTGTALVHYDPALVAPARLRAVVESSAPPAPRGPQAASARDRERIRPTPLTPLISH